MRLGFYSSGRTLILSRITPRIIFNERAYRESLFERVAEGMFVGQKNEGV